MSSEKCETHLARKLLQRAWNNDEGKSQWSWENHSPIIWCALGSALFLPCRAAVLLKEWFLATVWSSALPPKRRSYVGAALIMAFPFCGPWVIPISTAMALRGSHHVCDTVGFFHIPHLFGEALPEEKLCRGFRLWGVEGMVLRL